MTSQITWYIYDRLVPSPFPWDPAGASTFLFTSTYCPQSSVTPKTHKWQLDTSLFLPTVVSETAPGDFIGSTSIGTLQTIRIDPQYSKVDPPVNDHPTVQQPAQQVHGVSGRLRKSRTAGGLFRGEANTHGENIRSVSWGYYFGKSMLCSTRT